jgi:hypothetical protein
LYIVQLKLISLKFKMTKIILYNPDKCGSFQMMFGFTQPANFKLQKRYWNKQLKKYENKKSY